jgi:voltage-gated sodium channel
MGFTATLFAGMKSSLGLMMGIKPSKENKASKEKKQPEDYYVNPQYHEDLSEVQVQYMNFCCEAKKVADAPWFNNGVIITIIIAGINVGVQTYEASLESNKAVIMFFSILDDFIWCIFAAEVFTKFFAGGIAPFQYFYGPEWKWNNFDFAIVVLSIPTFIMPPFFAGSGSIALLRLVRLARLGKLIKKIPQLQMIMRGLLGGLSSIGYIILLLFLVFYLYAVVGFYLFKENDPFHFGTLILALTTLFRVATLANWGDVMYLNMYGCAVYPVYDYYDPSSDDLDFSGYSSSEIADLENALADGDVYDALDADDQGVVDSYEFTQSERFGKAMYQCANSSTSELVAPIFFISFVVISALVMLSLFIGAVTMSMTDSMDELKRLTEERKRMVTFEKNRQKILSLMAAEEASVAENASREDDKSGDAGRSKSPDPAARGRRSSVQIAKQIVHKASFGRAFSSEFAPVSHNDLVKEHAEHKVRMRQCLQHALGDIAFEEREREAEKQRQLGMVDEMWYWNAYIIFCDAMMVISKNSTFNNFVTFVIIIAGINVGASTDRRITDWKSFCQKDDSMDESTCPTLESIDLIILVIFTVEFFVKFFAEKFHLTKYFQDGWNDFDFFIVAASWIAFITGSGGQVAILRLLRLLRVLKLVKSFKKLAIIVNALIMGLGSIGYVGVILFLTFYVFAILGIILFADNDPWHFGTLHDAMITLFRASTLDDWAELMYLEMYGCKIFPEVYEDFPDECTDPYQNWLIASAYFTIFIVIAAQVLLTLFIGVISTSMDQARDDKKEEEELEEELAKVAKERGLDATQISSFNEVFNMLDLDRGGTIEEEELMIGLTAIQDDMAPYEVQEILKKVDPKNEGVNLVGFIQFMCLTPKYRANASAHRIMLLWNSKKTKVVLSPFQQWWADLKQKWIPHTAAFKESLRMEAAMIIQSAWRAKLEFAHKKSSSESSSIGPNKAYSAMQERLKKAEDALVEREKETMASPGGLLGGLGSSPLAMTSLEFAITDNMVEETEERRQYGNELVGENYAKIEAAAMTKQHSSKLLNKVIG